MKTIIILAWAVLFSQLAHAGLGDAADSIERDQHALSGKRSRSKTLSAYSVEEISTGSGTIREYVSSTGQVFAVAWTGYRHPDLSVLLGAHFNEYQTALRQSPRKRGQRNGRAVAGANVVVETWGHIRNLQGRAFLPSHLPEGVTKHEIR